MSERKVVVPEGMLKAAFEIWLIFGDYPVDPETTRRKVTPILEAALRWIDRGMDPSNDAVQKWFASIFLAPEPEVPEVEGLQLIALSGVKDQEHLDFLVRKLQGAAYRLGKQSKERP